LGAEHHWFYWQCSSSFLALLPVARPSTAAALPRRLSEPKRISLLFPNFRKVFHQPRLSPYSIIAVFDIDDTTLFTSGGFQWGAKHYGNDIVSAGVSLREGDLKTDEDKRKFREFWTKMNNELDEYSVPKWIARELIELHKKRGDKIYFVTKRINTGSEHLTALLKDWFALPNLEPVIFTQREPKTAAFVKIHAQISYGDSDGDIRDSIAAGARPIRVMRARTSVNHEPTHNGAFGEDVLIDSEF
jgi:acid phosphatase (class B)